MKLSDRIKQQETPERRPVPGAAVAASRVESAMSDFKSNVHEALHARLGTQLFDSSLSLAQLTAQVTHEINDLMDSTTAPLSTAERQALANDILSDVVGLGPIEQFLADPEVSEIMVNSLDFIYVERHGRHRAHRRSVHLGRAPPAGGRPDRQRGRPPHRRVVADGRRPPARRIPRERRSCRRSPSTAPR
jgi:hypothetical protein